MHADLAADWFTETNEGAGNNNPAALNPSSSSPQLPPGDTTKESLSRFDAPGMGRHTGRGSAPVVLSRTPADKDANTASAVNSNNSSKGGRGEGPGTNAAATTGRVWRWEQPWTHPEVLVATLNPDRPGMVSVPQVRKSVRFSMCARVCGLRLCMYCFQVCDR